MYCSGKCIVQDPTLERLPTRYRVTEKRLYDGVDLSPDIFTFQYDGGSTNDEWNSAAVETGGTYQEPYSEYRGNAISRMVSPSGAATMTFYSQDDVKKGRILTTITSRDEFYEGFDETTLSAYSGNWSFTHAGSRQFVDRGESVLDDDHELHDTALRTTTVSTNWDTIANRTPESLTNGEGVLVNFLIEGDNVETIFGVVHSAWGQAAYRRWSLVVNADKSFEAQYWDGSQWTDQSLGMSAVEQRWYSLLP